MEIKYRGTPLWKIAGVSWLLVSLMCLISLIFFNEIMWNSLFIVVGLISVLSLFLSYNYFRLTSIDYIRIKDNMISIHNGFVRPRKLFNVSDVKEFIYSGNNLILQLKNEKRLKVKNESMNKTDLENLKIRLSELLK